MRMYLIENGCDPTRKVWRGPRDKDLSDEKWEEYYHQHTWHVENVCIDEDMDIEGVIANAFATRTSTEHINESIWGVEEHGVANARTIMRTLRRCGKRYMRM